MVSEYEEVIVCPHCDGAGEIIVDKETGKTRIVGEDYSKEKKE
jgi:hypothetical protein